MTDDPLLLPLLKTGYFTHDCVAIEGPRIACPPEGFIDVEANPGGGSMASPESPERLDKIEELMIATGLEDRVRRYEAGPADVADVLLAHDPDYVEALRRASEGDEEALERFSEPDSPVGPKTYEAAMKSVGAVVSAVNEVLSSRLQNAFCAIRPPGHHAKRDKAGGFCFFNNVAVGALHAMKVHGIRRVLVVDFDVHHGDGTESILGGVDGVQFHSLFQWPLFPSVLPEEKPSNVYRLPLPAGTTGAELLEAVKTAWTRAIDRFAPELILVSAGFDAHTEEKMAQLKLGEADFASLTRWLMDFAERHASGRIVSVLEGGYSLRCLARSVLSHLNTMVRYSEKDRCSM